MRKYIYLLLAAFLIICFAACDKSDDNAGDNGPVQTEDGDSGGEGIQIGQDSDDDAGTEGLENTQPGGESEEDEEMKQAYFYTVGDKTFTAAFAENQGADDFRDLLSEGDLTIFMSNYGGFEKVGPLGTSLSTENSQITAQPGDVMLYQGNQIVIFYGSNSWSYTRLGKVEDTSGWKAALGTGDVEVTFSLENE